MSHLRQELSASGTTAVLVAIGVAIGVVVALILSDVILGVIAGAGFIALTVQTRKLWTGGSSRQAPRQ